VGSLRAEYKKDIMKPRLYVLMGFICSFLLLMMDIQAQQQTNGTIKGQVKTNDATAAAMVTVQVKRTKRSTLTDNAGTFILRNIKPGNYELEISLLGYESVTKTVSVEENKTVSVTIEMNLSRLQLQEVIVTSSKNQYNSKQLSSSLRLNEPLMEVSQNIQVVTSATLADQQVVSMSDGLIRNVSGAMRVEHWADMYTNIVMRGSQIQAFRNGFNVVNSSWGPLTEDMSIVDHIEFVKGPAGFMLANGDPSGLYNVVTKKPTGQTRGEVSLTLGSYDLYRASLDLDGKLSKDGKLLYRLNLAGQNKGSHRPNEFNDRYTFAPVISYQIDDRTKLTAEYTLQTAKMSDLGSYYVFAPDGYAKYPVDFTTIPTGLDPTRITDHSVFVNLQHDLTDHWKLTTQIGYLNYRQKGSSMWPWAVNPDGTMIRGVGIWDAKSAMTLGQAFINGNINTGKIAHRILGGVDIGKKEYFADYATSHPLDSVGAEFDPLHPYYGTPVMGYPSFDRTLNLEARAVNGFGTMTQRYTGIYLQDELGFLDNTVRLTLAGRYTTVDQSNYGGPVASHNRITPRIGLSVSVDRNTSIYALHDQAFIPQTGNITGGGAVKPITGSNTEFGIKRDWANGKWNTTLSVYRIIKKNELTGDPTAPANSGLSIVLGEKRAEGIEFDLKGSIVRGLNVIANYAYTDGRVTKADKKLIDSNIIKVGDAVPGFAKHTFNTWIGYKQPGGPLKGAGISGGFTYLIDRASSNWNNSDTRFNLPDYFKLDGGIFWEKNKVKLTLNVFNILDKYLYSGGYYSYLPSFYWQTEPPRNFRFSMNYKF
jgi:iron complex outermembrane receptor protein